MGTILTIAFGIAWVTLMVVGTWYLGLALDKIANWWDKR